VYEMKTTERSTEPCRTLQVTSIALDITPFAQKSESGQTGKMKANPLQTCECQMADQGWLVVWSGQPYQMLTLNPV